MRSSPPPPSREEVGARLRSLAAATVSPDEADHWASRWVVADDSGVDDPVVWQGLTHLCGASVRRPDGEYLYGPEDFRAWLAQFQDAAADPRMDERARLWRTWREAEVRLENAIEAAPDGTDTRQAREYLEHNEYGLALESLVEQVAVTGAEGSWSFWAACSDAAEVMGLDDLARELRRRP